MKISPEEEGRIIAQSPFDVNGEIVRGINADHKKEVHEKEIHAWKRAAKLAVARR